MNDSSSSPAGAWRDWWGGTRSVDLWWTLARYDILLRYRRSLLGPLWITLSMGTMLLGMGPLYSRLLDQPLNKFYPYLTLGIIFWHFFSATINEGCQVFIAAAPYLKQGRVSCSVFVWRNLTRQVIQLAHHIVLYLPVAWWSGVGWSPNMLLFVPWFLLVLVNLHALVIILGIVSARFRDVPQIVASMLQLLMFLTPVFWMPDRILAQETAPTRTRFILYNPLAQMLDVLRLPLLGDRPASGTCWFLLDFTLLAVAVAAVLYATQRRRIVYWV
jgi:lipopolysaccharide transport system permease protein